jgi:RHS repeat-associated protein
MNLRCDSDPELLDTYTALLSSVTAFSKITTTNVYNGAGYLSQINDSGGTPIWTANTVDAEGHLTQETAGSGGAPLVTAQTYYPDTGRLEAITSGTGQGQPGSNITNLSYAWDDLGNLVNRTDTLQSYDENFCYDSLNRLTTYALNDGGGGTCTQGTIQKTVGYDGGGIGDGNMTTKSDMGGYTYGQHGAGPHAVSSIDTSATGGCTLASCKLDGLSRPKLFGACPPAAPRADRGDADGNMSCVTTRNTCDLSAARTYTYTSFDMAGTIVNGSATTTLAYTPEHSRGSLTSPTGTLYYFANPAAGVANELAQDGVTWHTYLAPYGHIVAEFFGASATIAKSYYFAGDHLASTTALTDPTGARDEYDSYDAWGNRRNASGTDYPTGCLTFHPGSLTLRGFTGQEEMDNLCLVNLNARLYDPALGRMLSADPTVPGAMNGQAYNRYSYVTNNPLSFTDPSGHIEVYGVTPHIYCYNGCQQGDGYEDEEDSYASFVTGSRIPGGDPSLTEYSTNDLTIAEFFIPFGSIFGGYGNAGGLSPIGPSITFSGWTQTVVGTAYDTKGNYEGTMTVNFWGDSPTLIGQDFMQWDGEPGGGFGTAGDSGSGNGAGPFTAEYMQNAERNLRNYIASPQGVQMAQSLQMWGNSFRWAGDWVAVGAYGTDVVGTVTFQPELVAAGTIGETVALGLYGLGDAFSGTAAEMEAIQQESYVPITQFTFGNYPDLPPNPLGDR